MIDEQKLRKLAEAATPGPWHWDSDPIKGDPLDRVRFRVVATGRTITQCYYSSGDRMAQKEAEWIASANPSAILALLDELQSLRSEHAAIEANTPAVPGVSANLVALLSACRDFIDSTTQPAYPAGAELADAIDLLLAAPQPQPVAQPVQERAE